MSRHTTASCRAGGVRQLLHCDIDDLSHDLDVTLSMIRFLERYVSEDVVLVYVSPRPRRTGQDAKKVDSPRSGPGIKMTGSQISSGRGSR
jgi:hypothetical protein